MSYCETDALLAFVAYSEAPSGEIASRKACEPAATLAGSFAVSRPPAPMSNCEMTAAGLTLWAT